MPANTTQNQLLRPGAHSTDDAGRAPAVPLLPATNAPHQSAPAPTKPRRLRSRAALLRELRLLAMEYSGKPGAFGLAFYVLALQNPDTDIANGYGFGTWSECIAAMLGQLRARAEELSDQSSELTPRQASAWFGRLARDLQTMAAAAERIAAIGALAELADEGGP